MLGSLIAVPVSLPAYAWFFNCLRPALASCLLLHLLTVENAWLNYTCTRCLLPLDVYAMLIAARMAGFPDRTPGWSIGRPVLSPTAVFSQQRFISIGQPVLSTGRLVLSASSRFCQPDGWFCQPDIRFQPAAGLYQSDGWFCQPDIRFFQPAAGLYQSDSRFCQPDVWFLLASSRFISIGRLVLSTGHPVFSASSRFISIGQPVFGNGVTERIFPGAQFQQYAIPRFNPGNPVFLKRLTFSSASSLASGNNTERSCCKIATSRMNPPFSKLHFDIISPYIGYIADAHWKSFDGWGLICMRLYPGAASSVSMPATTLYIQSPTQPYA